MPDPTRIAEGVVATRARRRAEVLALLAGEQVPAVIGATDGTWSEWLRIAGARLYPWIAFRMDRLGLFASLPSQTREVLQAATLGSTVHELQRRTAFAAATRALDAAGIGFVVLKGMVLAYTAYPTPAPRVMGDIDLWVEPEHLDATRQELRSLGWRTPERYSVYSPLPADTPAFELPGTRAMIELHAPPPSIARDAMAEANAVWARCEPRSLGGCVVRTCGLDDQLVHLCLHLARRNAFRDGLLNLLDVALAARLVDGGDAAWRDLGQAHRDRRVTAWTVPTLVLARDLLHAPIPAAYFEATGAAAPTPELLAAATEQLWDRDVSLFPGLDLVLASRPRSALSFISSYVRNFHLAPPAAGQSWGRALGARFRFDLTSRLSRYARAFWQGEFRPRRLAHRVRMLRARRMLVTALQDDDLTNDRHSGSPTN